MLVTKFSMPTVHKILHYMEKNFWDYDKFEGTLQIKLAYIESTVRKSFKIFIYITFSCAVIMLARPLLLKERRYPLMTYDIFDKYNLKNYIFIYCWQITTFVFGANMLFAVDGLYILFVTNVYIQLEMLIYCFSTIDQSTIHSQEDEDICYRKIILYVRHHNTILRYN